MGTDVQLAAIVLAFIHQNETVYADQVKKLLKKYPGAPGPSVVPGRLRGNFLSSSYIYIKHQSPVRTH